MQGAEERRLRRISHTSQGGAIEGNAADDALMVDQRAGICIDKIMPFIYKVYVLNVLRGGNRVYGTPRWF